MIREEGEDCSQIVSFALRKVSSFKVFALAISSTLELHLCVGLHSNNLDFSCAQKSSSLKFFFHVFNCHV